MAIAEFRRIALSIPEASEDAHMGHPDSRVNWSLASYSVFGLGAPESGDGR